MASMNVPTLTRPDTPAEAAPGAAQDSVILNEVSAAQRLGLAPRTLQRLRLNGDGPAYVRLTPGGSRIGYAVADLKAWVAARTVAARQ